MHCVMAFLFIFHYLSCSFFIQRAKILKGVALSSYYVMQTAAFPELMLSLQGPVKA